MHRIIILGPGKSGTTFLGSKLLGAKVFHNVGPSRFTAFSTIKRLLFFGRLMFLSHTVILPYRDDLERRKSVFWNDLEKALMHYKTTGSDYKVTRYASPKVFLQACFEHYPYETYQQWFDRNRLHTIIRFNEIRAQRRRFYGSEIIMCPINEIDTLLDDLASKGIGYSDKEKVNSKDEFWHKILHKFVRNKEQKVER